MPENQTFQSEPSLKVRVELASLFSAGIQSVTGEKCIAEFIEKSNLPKPNRIIALGKAAYSMVFGLPLDWQANVKSLIVTKEGHAGKSLGPQMTLIEAGHPIPNLNSLRAGKQALYDIQQCTADDHILVLVSGGASALVEDLKHGLTLEDLSAMTKKLISEGLSIDAINAERIKGSNVKGGALLSAFQGRQITVLAISDVRGDNIDIIGSGIGGRGQTKADYDCHIVASNAIARDAITQAAMRLGHKVHFSEETLYTDIHEAAAHIETVIEAGDPGIYIFGGEPTVLLPENPGEGGRNQALALLIAQRIEGRRDIQMLVAGTDGTDGTSIAAGAFVDGRSFRHDLGALIAIETASSSSYFAKSGDQFITGPTGTNVMDVVIAVKMAKLLC